MQNGICEAFKSRDKLLNETLFFALDRARRIAAWVAHYDAARAHSAPRYETPAASAAQFAATGDRLHTVETFRQSPSAYSTQAGK